MYYVYILQSQQNSARLYKGFTRNLQRRILDHNSGYVLHTKKYLPWKMVFYCAFTNKYKALEFEQYLKTASGIAFMRKRLVDMALSEPLLQHP